MTDSKTNPNTSSTAEPSALKKGRWHLRAMLLVTFVPLIAAYVAYYTGWGVPQTTVNNGVLLEPALDTTLLLADASGEPLDLSDIKWRLLIPVTDPCNKACQQNLYVTRQVHVRLGEKAERIERVALAVGDAAEAYLADIRAEHPRLKILSISPSGWQDGWQGNQMPAAQEAEHFYFLVDPQGFAFLRYSEAHEGNALLKDIKRILRYTPEA